MTTPTAYEMQKLEAAKANGFAFFLVKGEGDVPPFVYSIGMAQHGLPDVLMFLDSTYCKPQIGMLTNFLNHLLTGVKRFSAEMMTSMLNGMSKTVTDPEITYHFHVLSPSDTDRAVYNYACRTHFFRKILGDPQIMVVCSDFNPTWEEVSKRKQTTA